MNGIDYFTNAQPRGYSRSNSSKDIFKSVEQTIQNTDSIIYYPRKGRIFYRQNVGSQNFLSNQKRQSIDHAKQFILPEQNHHCEKADNYHKILNEKLAAIRNKKPIRSKSLDFSQNSIFMKPNEFDHRNVSANNGAVPQHKKINIPLIPQFNKNTSISYIPARKLSYGGVSLPYNNYALPSHYMFSHPQQGYPGNPLTKINPKNEIKSILEKQTDTLEKLVKNVDVRPRTRSKRESSRFNDIEQKIKQLETVMELKLKLIKQEEALKSSKSKRNSTDFGNDWNAKILNKSESCKNVIDNCKDQIINYQNHLITSLTAAKNSMYYPGFYDYQYGNYYQNGYIHQDDYVQKKKKHVKKSKSSKKHKTTCHSLMIQKHLRNILWTLTYPHFLKKDILEKIEKRKAGQLNRIKNKRKIQKNLTMWLFNSIGKPLMSILKDKKKNNDFIGSESSGYPTHKDVKSRAKNIQNIVKNLLECLSKNLNLNLIHKDGLEYLATISLGELYVLDNTLSTYEIKRLKLNSYGRYIISQINQKQSQMILGCSLMIQVLALELLQSTERWRKIEWTDQFKKTMKIIASVIYRLNLSIYDKLEVINPNPSKLKIVPLRLLGIDSDKNLNNTEQEIILGMFNRDKLNPVFESQECKIRVETVTKLQQSLNASIYNKVLEYRKETLIHNAAKRGE